MNITIIFFRIIRYIRYWLLAMDEHSLQSPYLFNLYQQALNPARRGRLNSAEVEALRRRLHHDERKIELNAFGSGSSMSSPRSKRIKNIARLGITSKSQSEILVNLLEYQGSKVVLELGTSLGVNTIYLSRAKGVEHVVTVDGNTDLCEIARSHFSELKLRNIEQVNSDIDTFLQELDGTFDFIYIDANHTYEATRCFFSKSLHHLSDSGIIILDDINWSPEMSKAWTEIQDEYPDHLYIENDKIGIVFANVESVKRHYILRF
ncbi:MAG: class I SAM-dependent methyltransferase [Reichenbachiella sp.]|uniref:O-methyltransferase n=1 Tax=Reichenbachiella sp. TaxID=2184521 RepID=UPI0029669A5F|nr:class I SAM-dependent methyltransferase [Reichenbachiella sp.]MDW3210526.1 class I SAM-dependent methyltransferase [Reichenbachiella sp.]